MKVMVDWAEKDVEWKEYKPKKTRERRKLLITTDNFLPRWDGISRFLSEVIPRLQDTYDITVVAPDYGHVKIDNVNVEKIPLSTRSYGDYTPPILSYRKVSQLVKETDLVFNQALGPIGVCAILGARRHKVPLVGYIHSVEWELVPKAIAVPSLRAPLIAITRIVTRWFYNRCTVLITPSENIAELFSWQGIKPEKHIAHLGVNIRKFRQGDKKKAREKLGLPQDVTIIGYHGRISHEKNLLTLLRGFKRLKRKKVHLVIVGDGVLEIKSKLERQKNVTVTGNQDNVVPWLQAMDIYVQPSLTETTSLSLLEAMACQLPVVTSKVGFIQYYVIDGENGLFFENTNSHDLMVKLEELLKSKTKREKLSVNARKTIETSFKWENTAEKIKDVLDSI